MTLGNLIAAGIALGTAACCLTASGQYVANDLATLRSLAANLDNATITLQPGDYWIDGDHIANPTSSIPTFLDLGGNNNTYNLTGANLKLDTRDLAGFGRALGHDSGVEVVRISGTNNTVQGLNLTGYDLDLDTDPNARRYADWAAVYVQLTGTDNTVQDVNVLSRGSSPYGLGDAFGKGGRQFPQGEPPGQVSGEPDGVVGLPWVGHNKTSAFQVLEATRAVVDDMHLQVKTYGHGFFVQKSSDTTLINSTVTGELVPASNVINHPKYQEYGFTSHGNEIDDDIMISANEDGVRLYGSINGVPTVGFTVDNVVVTNMRSGFATALGFTDIANGLGITLNNVESYGAEVGFGLGSLTTVTNAKGDITNGPLIQFPYNNVRDTTIDIELVGDMPVGLDYAAAYLNGQRLDVTIDSDLDLGDLPADSMVRLGQTFFKNWRDTLHPTGPEDADPGDFIDSTFTNNTNQMVVLGNLTTNNTGSSQSPVITNGKNNAYDGISIVLGGTRTVLTSTQGLGNNGTGLDGSLETNASIVEAGATLEVQPGIMIQDEKLTISGNGIDGKGALYSDGSNGSDTRFGSSNTSDESTIFLDGHSSIGVGIAGNQLLVGRIQGTGNLTKVGPGTLTIGKSSTYDGSLIVAEGHVTARPGVVHTSLLVVAGASISGIGNSVFNTTGDIYLDGYLDLNSRTDDNALSGTIGRLSGSGSVGASNSMVSGFNTLTIDSPSGEISFSGQIESNINLVKSGVGVQILAGDNSYTGSTTINGGTLLMEGTHTGGGAYTVETGGTLGGNGSIEAGVTVQSGGTLAPGASAGELTLQTVELQSGAALAIELGGTTAGSDYDLLTADTITLGGDLAISLIDSGGDLFAPYASDTFTVVGADSLSGAFTNVINGERIDTVGGEGSFRVSYSGLLDSVILTDFIAAGLAGDFNADGMTDAADYTLWRDTVGSNGLTPYSGADANGDGQVTNADYDVWRNNFGATLSGASVSVPEPTSLILLLALGLVAFGQPPAKP